MTRAANGVLFDLDGTLADTREAILHAYRSTFEGELGMAMPVELEDPRLLMAPRPVEIFRDWGVDSDPAWLTAAYAVHYLAEGYRKVRAYPDVLPLLDRLEADGVPVGIVTNKGRERALLDLSWIDLPADRFRCLVTAEDSIQRKPDPTPILIGLERAGLKADGSWYVGDGPQDVLGGRAAGLRTAAATYGYYGADALIPLSPDALLERPFDLLAALKPGADR